MLGRKRVEPPASASMRAAQHEWEQAEALAIEVEHLHAVRRRMMRRLELLFRGKENESADREEATELVRQLKESEGRPLLLERQVERHLSRRRLYLQQQQEMVLGVRREGEPWPGIPTEGARLTRYTLVAFEARNEAGEEAGGLLAVAGCEDGPLLKNGEGCWADVVLPAREELQERWRLRPEDYVGCVHWGLGRRPDTELDGRVAKDVAHEVNFEVLCGMQDPSLQGDEMDGVIVPQEWEELAYLAVPGGFEMERVWACELWGLRRVADRKE